MSGVSVEVRSWLRARRVPVVMALGAIGVAALGYGQYLWYGDVGGIFDLWPVYHGARAWAYTGDAYWSDPALADSGGLAAVGNAYPLHAALLLGLPVAALPSTIAGPLWATCVGLAWVWAIWWARESWLWLLWLPMWDALRIQQVSAAVTVAAIVAVGAFRRGNQWAFLAALVVLTMKPQQTALLVLLLLWWARRWWVSALATLALLGVVLWAAQPGWIAAWLEQVGNRADLLQGEVWLTAAIIPLGAWLAFRGWPLTGAGIASSGLGPWPFLGHYSASLWPLGTDRFLAASLACLGAGGYLAGLLFGFWWYPVVLTVGLFVAAWIHPAGAPHGATGPEVQERQARRFRQ